MADRILTGPPSDMRCYAESNHESRILRDRQEAQNRAADRTVGAGDPYTTGRQLVQIYDGGAIPTAPNKFFLCRPVTLTGSSAEGQTSTTAVDATTTMPVLVLGNAPVAGDLLIAYAVGGRWVAERGSSGGGTGAPCTLNCPLPDVGSLNWTWATWPLGGTIYTGMGVSTWAGNWRLIAPWTAGASQEFLFTLGCNGNQLGVTVSLFPQGGNVVSIGQCGHGNSGTGCLILDSYACGSGFMLSLHVPEAQQAIFGLLQTLTITR
jgi:hypothetical protein